VTVPRSPGFPPAARPFVLCEMQEFSRTSGTRPRQQLGGPTRLLHFAKGEQEAGRGDRLGQPGRVIESTSSAASSCSRVSSPRSTKPRSIVASRTVMPFATECFAILAALS
jgi:hypothetical protein